MGRFDFAEAGAEETPAPALPVVRGNFSCQHCPERVREATVDRESQQLRWACSQGHQSHIDGWIA